jgi:hypothetical protein
VWGDDPEAYRPERWFEADKIAAMQKTFNPYSLGPRCLLSPFTSSLLYISFFPWVPCQSACIGRNLAALELLIIVASIMRRFHFTLADPDEPVCNSDLFPIPSWICAIDAAVAIFGCPKLFAYRAPFDGNLLLLTICPFASYLFASPTARNVRRLPAEAASMQGGD